MELLEQDLSDPSSPRPPPLPPRPALMPPLPGIPCSPPPEMPAAMTSPEAPATVTSLLEEPRYVSSPPRSSEAPRSAAAAAAQLRGGGGGGGGGRAGGRGGLARARTCCEAAGPTATPPALPAPRKFSLPLDSLWGADAITARRSPSPGQQLQQQQQTASPSTPVDGSPRSSPHLPHSKQHP